MSGEGWGLRTWLLLITVCGALFLDGLDISLVGVALPSISRALGLSPASLQWLVSAYVLGYGGLLLLGGRACDLLGRRRVFLVAVTAFGVASVVSGCCSSEAVIVALRFFKGVTAAFTVPAGLSILTTTFAEGPARNRALSIYSVCGASGFSLGLVLGGLLTELSWRAPLLFPGPVALALVALGWRSIPRSIGRRFTLAHFDVVGAASSTSALLLLVYGVVQAPVHGWGSIGTLLPIAAAVVLAGVFVRTETRHEHPLVRLAILRSVPLVHANLTGFAMFGGYAAFQFLVSLYVQDSLHWSPLAMALGFLPCGLIAMVSESVIGRLLDRYRTTLLIGLGLTSLGSAYALFLRTTPGMSYWSFMFPTMVLLGIGFALTFPAMNAQATAGIASEEQGLASGLLNTFVQVGGAVMLAIITAIVSSSGRGTPGGLLPGTRAALVVISVLTAVVVAGSVLVHMRGSVRPIAADVLLDEPA